MKEIPGSATARPPRVLKYGRCVVCGERVQNQENFITTSDGYCHRDCLGIVSS